LDAFNDIELVEGTFDVNSDITKKFIEEAF